MTALTSRRRNGILQGVESVSLTFEGRTFHIEIVRVTPELAEKWLEHNAKNRPIRARTIKRYAAIIAEARWLLNGETIIFDDAGNLVNGQHRLLACIESGKSFASFVIRGVSPDVFSAFDRGRLRSGADVLALLGQRNSSSLACAYSHLWRHLYASHLDRNAVPEFDQLVALYEKYPGLAELEGDVRYLSDIASPSLILFFRFIFSQIDATKAAEFFDALESGANLADVDPVLLLRNRLLKNKAQRAKLPAPEIIALVFKAWNLKCSDSVSSRLYGRRSGSSAEFPTIGWPAKES